MSDQDPVALLVEAQINGLRQVFERFDTDQDGYLLLPELAAALVAVGRAPDTGRLTQIGSLDRVSFGTFADLVEPRAPGDDIAADIREAFRSADADGDGFLSRDELRCAIAGADVCLTTEEVDQLMRTFDTNRDGRVSFVEFERAMWWN